MCRLDRHQQAAERQPELTGEMLLQLCKLGQAAEGAANRRSWQLEALPVTGKDGSALTKEPMARQPAVRGPR
jgi:hypothetical protein